MGFDLHNITRSLYDCMVSETQTNDVILRLKFPTLDIFPGNILTWFAEVK